MAAWWVIGRRSQFLSLRLTPWFQRTGVAPKISSSTRAWIGSGVAVIGLGFGIHPWHSSVVKAEVTQRIFEVQSSWTWLSGSTADKDETKRLDKAETGDEVQVEKSNASCERKSEFVCLESVQRSYSLVSMASWVAVITCWTSLVWLPICFVAVLGRLGPNGGSRLSYAVLTFLTGLYMLPFTSTSPGNSSGDRIRRLLEWFESVEVWAEAGALERHSPTLVCYHPHGVFTVGMMGIMLCGKELFPDGIVGLAAPYVKCFAPLLHCLMRFVAPIPVQVESVSKQSIHRVLSKKNNTVVMVPGGIQEATLTKLGHERVFLRRRKGFVKYALQHGYSLMPIYAFGESDLYDNLQFGIGWRLKLNEGFLGSPQGVPTVFPFGWSFCPLLPKPGVHLCIVVGAPVELPNIQEPTRSDIEHWHGVYVKALQALYSKAIVDRNLVNRPLEIV